MHCPPPSPPSLQAAPRQPAPPTTGKIAGPYACPLINATADFGETGALVSLVDHAAKGVNLAGGPLGEFIYRTHSQEEYDGWIRYYRVQYFRPPCTNTSDCNHGTAFYKPNISSAGAESIIQRPTLLSVTRGTSTARGCSFELRLALPFGAALHAKYGAPLTAHVNVTITRRRTSTPGTVGTVGTEATRSPPLRSSSNGPSALSDGAGPQNPNQPLGTLVVNFDLVLYNKSATRLPESMYFSFAPGTANHAKTSTLGGAEGGVYGASGNPVVGVAAPAAAGVRNRGGEWSVSKLGSQVSLFDVVQNGSQYQHGQWDGVSYVTHALPHTPASKVVFKSDDVAVVSPNVPDPTPFPAHPTRGMQPLTSNDISGVSFVLFSNGYNTNYPLWYPFTHGTDNRTDATMRFRFEAAFTTDTP